MSGKIFDFIRDLDNADSRAQVIIRPSRHTSPEDFEILIKSDIYYDEYNSITIRVDEKGKLVGCPDMVYTWDAEQEGLPETTSVVLELIDKHFLGE